MLEAISVYKAKKMENQDHTLIIDVRDKESYKQFHIKNSISLPYEKIENREYCLPKDYTLILYCERGGVSLIAARILDMDGYTVKTVIGGITAYRETENRKSKEF